MSNSKIEFFQCNLQHGKSATIETNFLKFKSQRFVGMIQEPYILKNVIRLIDETKYQIISYKGRDKLRSCIIASKNCEIFPLTQFCTGDLTVVSLKLKMHNVARLIVVASCYTPSEIDILPPSDDVINLVNHCSCNNLPLIIGTDANSHHVVWGSSDCNPKGDSLLEFISSSNLEILKRGNEPTFRNRIREEVLDITLASYHISHLIRDWTVTDDVLTSDHRCIRFNIGTDAVEKIQFRNPANTNWETFRSKISAQISPVTNNVNSIESLDNKADELMNYII